MQDQARGHTASAIVIGGHVGRGDGIGRIVAGCVVSVPKIPKIIAFTQETHFFDRKKPWFAST